MADDLGERTELPSQRRIEEARQRGQVARSADLTAAIDLVGALVLLVVFGGGLMRAFSGVLRSVLTSGVELPAFSELVREAVVQPALAAAPVLLIMLVLGVVANVAQFGLVWTLQPLIPRADRLSPVRGLGNIFGRRNVVRTAVNAAKLGVVGWIGYLCLSGSVEQIAALPLLPATMGMLMTGQLVLKLAAWLLVVLVVVGLVDFLYQRWQHTQDLKMTRQEVQDERRSMEGDPLVKGRRLRMARQIALQRVNQAVPKADVVVTNPTHFSIALEYDADVMRSPRVVAKGADYMAMRIRQVAIAHGVPIVERAPLARALYTSVEVGQEVSPEFYQAVAEVLAYVYRLEQEAAA